MSHPDPAERYAGFKKLREESERRIYESFLPTIREIGDHMAREVVEDPSLAGTGIDCGDFERGDVGAVRLVYPSLEQAQKHLAENPGGSSAG